MYSSKISFYDYVFHIGCPGNKFFDADENCICPAGLSDNGDYCGKLGVHCTVRYTQCVILLRFFPMLDYGGLEKARYFIKDIKN